MIQTIQVVASSIFNCILLEIFSKDSNVHQWIEVNMIKALIEILSKRKKKEKKEGTNRSSDFLKNIHFRSHLLEIWMVHDANFPPRELYKI